MAEPLERIADCLEFFKKSLEEHEKAEKKEFEVKNEAIDWKYKYDKLWITHQEDLRELIKLRNKYES